MIITNMTASSTSPLAFYKFIWIIKGDVKRSSFLFILNSQRLIWTWFIWIMLFRRFFIHIALAIKAREFWLMHLVPRSRLSAGCVLAPNQGSDTRDSNSNSPFLSYSKEKYKKTLKLQILKKVFSQILSGKSMTCVVVLNSALLAWPRYYVL